MKKRFPKQKVQTGSRITIRVDIQILLPVRAFLDDILKWIIRKTT